MSKKDSALVNKSDLVSTKDTHAVLQNTESIFSGHLLIKTHDTPIFNASNPTYWPGIVLFIIFSIYVLIRISEPKKIIKVFTSVFSLQEAKQLFREEFKLTKRVSILLGISFILVMAFFVQIINEYFGLILNNYSQLKQFIFFIAVIGLMYLIKFLSNYLLAFITSNEELGKEYLFNVYVFSQTIGIVLFPMVICLQFTKYPIEWFLYPALIICSGFYALRMFRGFVISSSEQNIGILYIFLYLCALEILPLLVLIKFLLVNF
ncbi:MAG: hypothetical protein C0448_03460 [Sphingobacteriaceae bacterium]|nr:hypothetical protein [Sphingobacteriaceae bacterium]